MSSLVSWRHCCHASLGFSTSRQVNTGGEEGNTDPYFPYPTLLHVTAGEYGRPGGKYGPVFPVSYPSAPPVGVK